jgi:hypothetical protein
VSTVGNKRASRGNVTGVGLFTLDNCALQLGSKDSVPVKPNIPQDINDSNNCHGFPTKRSLFPLVAAVHSIYGSRRCPRALTLTNKTTNAAKPSRTRVPKLSLSHQQCLSILMPASEIDASSSLDHQPSHTEAQLGPHDPESLGRGPALSLLPWHLSYSPQSHPARTQ